MNWKNISLETGFVKQQININGAQATNYIPLEQVDSFGVVSTERKLWIIIAGFFALCSIGFVLGQQIQAAFFSAVICAVFAAIYYATRQIWLSITSSQTKFNFRVINSVEEMRDVNAFVEQMKKSIHHNRSDEKQRVA